MFVGINFFRHEPRTVAPLQSIRWAKEFCLACNVKCMLFLSFLHVPMSVPPLGILYALPRRFSTASCPSPSPLTKDKDAERGWSRWKGVGGMGRWKGEMVGEVGWRWCEGGSKMERGWSEGWMKGGVWRMLPKIDTKYKDTSWYVYIAFIQIICVIHCWGFSPSLFTSPQLFLFSAPLHPSTFPSPLNTFIPVPKRMLGAESVERSEQVWKAERVTWSWGDGQDHDEGLGSGAWWKADGWRKTTYSFNRWKWFILTAFISSRFFSKVLWSSVEVVVSSSIFCICLQRSKL